MTVRDRILPKLDLARARLAALGLRQYTVTVVVEQYDKEIQNGAVKLSPASSVTLSPPPDVVQLAGEKGAAFGAGTLLRQSTGEVVVSVYQVGPITASYSGGGYTALQLLPAPAANDPSQRAVWMLTGPGLASGGEPFEVASYTADEFGLTAIVRRVAVYA